MDNVFTNLKQNHCIMCIGHCAPGLNTPFLCSPTPEAPESITTASIPPRRQAGGLPVHVTRIPNVGFYLPEKITEVIAVQFLI